MRGATYSLGVSTILIRSARVIDPASHFDAVADIAIGEGRIIAIGPDLPTGPAERVIDAAGLIASPGLIDPHVHLREPGQTGKEDIASGARAAVSGGFTTVCCMPNTLPALDTPEMIEYIVLKAAGAACRVFPVAAATKGRKGEALAEIGLCAQAGAVGVSDDGDVIASAAMMRSVLLAAREAGLAVMQHCQDPTLTVGAAMHEGHVAARLGLIGWPREAEEIIIERDVRLAASAGARYHVQHLSSGGSVEIIRRARAAHGALISAEASPHHLLLTHEACAGPEGEAYDTNAKMNPPLREQPDIDAIIAGLIDGTITVLATDHAPHTAEEKARPFEEAPFGIIGLESALGACGRALIEPSHLDWPRMLALMTIEPARLCTLDRLGLGMLAVDGPADITLIDPAARWVFGPEHCSGKSRNSPFFGATLHGRAVMTIVEGVVRFEV